MPEDSIDGSVGGADRRPAPDDAAATRDFYGRWAALYDRIATLPPVEAWRERAVDALALSPGDTVVEMGCGTGANLPHLRDRVGPAGTILGLDLASGTVRRARRRVRRAGWENVAVCQADATALPVRAPVDAVLGTFVVGMLPDPGGTVGDWFESVRPGGRVVLMDAVPTDRTPARPLNLPFAAFVWASAPVKRRGIGRPSRRLASRVATARASVRSNGEVVVSDSFGLGFLRLIAGRKPSDQAD